MKKSSPLYFYVDQRKLYRPKLQRGLHLWDFSSFTLQSHLQIHIYIHFLVPRFKRKTPCKKCHSFTILFPSQRYSFGHLISPFHSWGGKGALRWRERAQTPSHIFGTRGARAADSWHFTCHLAIRHTGWIHYIFHKYHMLNAAQRCVITISENTATNNFYVWPFVTLNLQLSDSLFPAFAFMDV